MIRIRSLRQIAWVMGVLCLSLPAQGDALPERLQEIFDQGWALESRMHEDIANLDRAIQLYEEAVSLAPDNAEAHFRLAEVIFKRSEETKDPDKRKEMVEKSISLAEKALVLKPDCVGGLYWAGTGYARLAEMSGIFSAAKQVKLAKNYLYRAMETDPNHRFAILAGVILSAIYAEAPWPLKDMDKALDLALVSVKKDPHLTIAALRLGKVYLAMGKKELATTQLKRCLEIKPPTYVWDAVLYDWPEARKMLKEMGQ